MYTYLLIFWVLLLCFLLFTALAWSEEKCSETAKRYRHDWTLKKNWMIMWKSFHWQQFPILNPCVCILQTVPPCSAPRLLHKRSIFVLPWMELHAPSGHESAAYKLFQDAVCVLYISVKQQQFFLARGVFGCCFKQPVVYLWHRNLIDNLHTVQWQVNNLHTLVWRI